MVHGVNCGALKCPGKLGHPHSFKVGVGVGVGPAQGCNKGVARNRMVQCFDGRMLWLSCLHLAKELLAASSSCEEAHRFLSSPEGHLSHHTESQPPDIWTAWVPKS